MKLLQEYKYWIIFLLIIFSAVIYLEFRPAEKELSEIESLKSNWEQNNHFFTQAYSFMISKVPKKSYLGIYFDDENISAKYINYQSIDSQKIEIDKASISNIKVKGLLAAIGWDTGDLLKLKGLLEKAHMQSISNDSIVYARWSESSFNGYAYLILLTPLSDSLKKIYNDSCEFILYKPNVVLVYEGGPAWSSGRCFPELKMKERN